MSRTFRRKNYENQCGKHAGSKIAGFYTVWEYVSWNLYVYREPTEQEYYDEYWRVHGESRNANAWTPSRWFRDQRQKHLRTQCKQQIHKFMKNPEHEVICEANPRSHYWDWS